MKELEKRQVTLFLKEFKGLAEKVHLLAQEHLNHSPYKNILDVDVIEHLYINGMNFELQINTKMVDMIVFRSDTEELFIDKFKETLKEYLPTVVHELIDELGASWKLRICLSHFEPPTDRGVSAYIQTVQ